MSNSIQAECRKAMHRLAERGIHFTERDVVEAASMPDWTHVQLVKAGRAAYTVLQSEYRSGKLSRFGPVSIPDYENLSDYVRMHSKIVYADAERGPSFVETPNGVFHKMFAANDRISAVGRRPGIDRDDFTAWDQQGKHDPVRPSETREAAVVAAKANGEVDEKTLSRLTDLLVPRVAAKLAGSLAASVK